MSIANFNELCYLLRFCITYKITSSKVSDLHSTQLFPNRIVAHWLFVASELFWLVVADHELFDRDFRIAPFQAFFLLFLRVHNVDVLIVRVLDLCN